MIQETMNIHKALSEVKILNDRITSRILGSAFVAANKVDEKRIQGLQADEWKEKAKADWDGVNALIARRNAIKRAVNKSNAETTIQLNTGTYSIAEAIEMKQYGITYLNQLLSKLRSSFATENARVERNNNEADEKATTYAQNCVGSDKQASQKDIEAIRTAYLASHKWELVDPINATERIRELEDYIDKFQSEVDSAIAVSNATTLISIEY